MLLGVISYYFNNKRINKVIFTLIEIHKTIKSFSHNNNHNYVLS